MTLTKKSKSLPLGTVSGDERTSNLKGAVASKALLCCMIRSAGSEIMDGDHKRIAKIMASGTDEYLR